MTLANAATNLFMLMTARQTNIDLNGTIWKTHADFFNKGIIQDVAAKKIIFTVVIGADSDIVDDIEAAITAIDGVI